MRTKTLALLLSIVMLAAVSHADTSGSVMGTVKAISANSITVETMDKAPKPVTDHSVAFNQVHQRRRGYVCEGPEGRGSSGG